MVHSFITLFHTWGHGANSALLQRLSRNRTDQPSRADWLGNSAWTLSRQQGGTRLFKYISKRFPFFLGRFANLCAPQNGEQMQHLLKWERGLWENFRESSFIDPRGIRWDFPLQDHAITWQHDHERTVTHRKSFILLLFWLSLSLALSFSNNFISLRWEWCRETSGDCSTYLQAANKRRWNGVTKSFQQRLMRHTEGEEVFFNFTFFHPRLCAAMSVLELWRCKNCQWTILWR